MLERDRCDYMLSCGLTETAEGARTACWLKRGDPISRPSLPECESPETRDRDGQVLINLSAPLSFFFFSAAALSPPPLYTLCHLLASFPALRYCHFHSCPGHFIPPSPTSPFVSPLLRPFSPALCSFSLPSFVLHLSLLPLQPDVPLP